MASRDNPDDRADPPQRTGWSGDRLLLLALGTAVAVRLAWLWLEPRCELAGDEPSWVAMGKRMVGRPGRLSPLRNELVFYPPVYPYFLALLHRLLGSLDAMRAVQAVVAALAVPAIFRVGRLAYGARAGALAAFVAALYPELVWFSVHFWSETLFLVLLWWAIERLIVADVRQALGPATAAGALWGLSALTREAGLMLAPVAIAWLAWRGGRRWRAAGAFALGLLLTVAPWTIRNAIVFRAFIPISTMGAENLWVGNTTSLSPSEISATLQQAGGAVEQDRLAWRNATDEIRRRQPLWLLEKVRSEMPAFWSAGSEILDHLEGRLVCGPLSAGATWTARAVVAAPYLLVIACFVVGLCLVRPTAPAALLLLLLAAYNLVHVLAFATPRFRLPLLPVAFVVGAAAVAAWREGRLLRPDGRRLAGLVLVSAAALAVVWPSLRDLVR